MRLLIIKSDWEGWESEGAIIKAAHSTGSRKMKSTTAVTGVQGAARAVYVPTHRNSSVTLLEQDV